MKKDKSCVGGLTGGDCGTAGAVGQSVVSNRPFSRRDEECDNLNLLRVMSGGTFLANAVWLLRSLKSCGGDATCLLLPCCSYEGGRLCC